MSKQEVSASISRPSSNALQSKHVIEDAIITGGQLYHIAERVEYPPEGGIYVHYKGMLFPKKGYPFPEAIYANDNLKRVTRFLITLISGTEMIPSIVVFAILPWKFKVKKIEQMIDEYVRIAIWMQNECYLIPDRYSNCSKEIGGFVFDFLIALGIDKKYHNITRADGVEVGMAQARKAGGDPVWTTLKGGEQGFLFAIARAVATIFEYDDAYRYRVEDLMSETTSSALYSNPQQEIQRLTRIYIAREKSHASNMVARISKLVCIALYHPKIKKAFKYALLDLKFEHLQLDNADRYHVLTRGDYDFVGRTLDERKRIYKELHMESKCHKVPVKVIHDKDGNTVGGKCSNCKKDLGVDDVYFNLPPMLEVK